MDFKKAFFILTLFIFLAGCQQTLATKTVNIAETQAANEENKQTATALAIEKIPTATETVSPIMLALTSGPQTAAANTPVPTKNPNMFEFTVRGEDCWISSNIDVKTGQTVKIHASGTVNTYGGNEGSNCSPNGQEYICGAIECPVQGVGYGALVGQLEDLEPFFVGEDYELVATKEGQLNFTVNDWTCEDNFGEFNLTITLE
jgi:hypothetical protein